MDQISPEDAFSHACAMEQPLEAIRNLALALDRIAQHAPRDREDVNGAAIVQELAHTIQARVDELDDIHAYFVRLHDPDRDKLDEATFTVADLARSLNISPKIARRRLRAQTDVKKPRDGWSFPASQRAKITAIVRAS